MIQLDETRFENLLKNLVSLQNELTLLYYDLGICKKFSHNESEKSLFPVKLCDLIKQEEFFVAMCMDSSRAAGLIYEDPQLFEGTYWKDPDVKKKVRIWVNPEKFLKAALNYNYRNRIEANIANQYKAKYKKEE